MSSGQGQSRPRLAGLDGLRGLAAVWIVLYHFGGRLALLMPRNSPLTRVFVAFAARGHLGVDIFFVLSGFALAYRYDGAEAIVDRRSYGRFFRARVARTIPAYEVALGVLLAGGIAYGAGRMGQHLTAPLVVANVALVQQWLGLASINGPAWALSTLWAMYLLFPFLAVGLRRVRSPVAAVACAVAAYALLLTVLSMRDTDSRILRTVCEFVVGGLLLAVFRATRSRRFWGPVAWTCLAVVVAAACLPAVIGSAGGEVDLWARPVLALLVLALACGEGGLARLLSSKPALATCAVSLSLFVSQWIPFRALDHLLPAADYAGRSAVVRLAVMIAYVLGIAATAVVLYVVVERPAGRWLRGARPAA
ncbi:MAG: acyltransferase [Thermoleophilia bacterium]